MVSADRLRLATAAQDYGGKEYSKKCYKKQQQGEQKITQKEYADIRITSWDIAEIAVIPVIQSIALCIPLKTYLASRPLLYQCLWIDQEAQATHCP